MGLNRHLSSLSRRITCISETLIPNESVHRYLMRCPAYFIEQNTCQAGRTHPNTLFIDTCRFESTFGTLSEVEIEGEVDGYKPNQGENKRGAAVKVIRVSLPPQNRTILIAGEVGQNISHGVQRYSPVKIRRSIVLPQSSRAVA